MATRTKRTAVSMSLMAIIIALVAVLRLWAGPQFGLDLTTQLIIVGVILFFAKLVFFLPVELRDDPPVNPNAPNPDATSNSD